MMGTTSTVATEVGRDPVFVQVETLDVEPLEIEFISSGTVPESGLPRYRTKKDGKMTVRLWMRRNNGLSIRFEDGAPLFNMAYATPFNEARKNFYTSGGALPLHYIPPRSSEGGGFTATYVGWRGEERIETLNLAGQTEARLSRPAAATLFSLAAGGLIASSGKRVLPRLDDDGITLRFSEPVYGTLTVRYIAEYLEYTVSYTLPAIWFERKSAFDPAMTNNERIARRKITPQEVKPILLCVDSPPGVGNMPEDRQWSTLWMQLINREYTIGEDEYAVLFRALQTAKDARKYGSNGAQVQIWKGSDRAALVFNGWPARALPVDSKGYLRKKILGRRLESKSLANCSYWFPAYLIVPYFYSDPKEFPALSNGVANNGAAMSWINDWPQLSDVAIHAIYDGVVVAMSDNIKSSTLAGQFTLRMGTHCTYGHKEGSNDPVYYCRSSDAFWSTRTIHLLKPDKVPAATITVAQLHAELLARCAVYGMDISMAEFVQPSSPIDLGNGDNEKSRSFFTDMFLGYSSYDSQSADDYLYPLTSRGQLTVSADYFTVRKITAIIPSKNANYPQPSTTSGDALLRPKFIPDSVGSYTPGTGSVVIDWHLEAMQ